MASPFILRKQFRNRADIISSNSYTYSCFKLGVKIHLQIKDELEVSTPIHKTLSSVLPDVFLGNGILEKEFTHLILSQNRRITYMSWLVLYLSSKRKLFLNYLQNLLTKDSEFMIENMC